MTMTRSFEQLRNIVEDWIKITNAQFMDITEEEKKKQPRLEWVFKINNVMIVYMIQGRLDRINLQSPIDFASEHRKETSALGDREFIQFLVGILEPLTIAGISTKFLQKNKEIQQISIQSYIDTELLQREKFFQKWDQIAAFRDIIIKKVQAKFGVKGMESSPDSSSSDKTIYG